MKYMILIVSFFLSFSITRANSISINQIVHSNYCDGAPSGSIDLEVESLFAPFTYVWSGPNEYESDNEDIFNLEPGEYCVVVTNSLCGVAELCVQVECLQDCPTEELASEIILENVISCICEGSVEQAFQLTFSENIEVSEVHWSNAGGYSSTEINPSDITMPGIYSVEVTDVNGCVVILESMLPACPSIQDLQFQVQPNCPSNGGNILTTITGGTLPFQYEWSNGVTGIADLYNIAAGNYSLTVTDANGCAIEGNVEVPIPENPPFDILGEVNHACNEDDGYIMLDMDGITQPYTIQWSLPGETEYRIGDLTNGNYYVTVTDANGCTGTEMFTIYGAPSFDHLVFPETCEPANDGHIELTANNDSNTEEVTIQWSDGVMGDLVRTGLDAGIYSVTITGNTSGCSVIKDNLSTHPTANSGEAPYLKSLKILASEGGVETLIYQGDWIESTSGCVQFQGGSQNLSQELVDAMGSGSVSWKALATYNQTVSIGTLVFTSQGNSFPLGINQTSNTQLLPLGSAQVALLVGSSGSFDITIESFASSPLGGATLNMYDYSASLTNCVDIPSINPANCEYEPPLDPAYIGSDPTHSFSFSCIDVTMVTNGDDTFCVDIGSTPEEHIQAVSWSINGGNWMPSPSNDLCLEVTPDVFGEYCALIKVVTGSTECAVKVCATYCAPPTNLNIIETVTDPSCTSASDGSICLDVTSDDVPLLISWETGEVESCIGDLAAGIYYYTLSPGEECDLMPGYPSAPHPIELGIDNTSLNIIEALTPSCAPGPGNGQACIYGSGGTPPYDIHWYDGTTFNCVTQLAPGSYDYTVSDACGATIEGSVEIEAITPGDVAVALPGPNEETCVSHLQFYLTSPTVLTVIITHNGLGAEFTQVFPASGGVPHHVLFEGILPGDYTVEIVDQCHNILQTFQEPVEDRDVNLIAGIKHHDFIRCEGGTGMFTVTLTDEGTLPYSILWSNGATTETIEGLTPGIYTVTVTDNNGCTSSHGLTMYVDDPLTILNAETTDACGEAGGGIDLVIEGGVASYSFNWSNGQIEQNLTNVEAGDYCVTVTDAEDCVVTGCYTVIQSDFEVVEALITDHECGMACNGAIDLTVNSSDPITYLWNNGETTQDISGLCAGIYKVVITSGDCITELEYEVGTVQDEAWEFDVEIVLHFNNDAITSGDARVIIHSPIFELDLGGYIRVYNSESMSILVAETFEPVLYGDGVLISIPEDFRDITTFYFTYTTEHGCVFSGHFDNEIGVCTWPDSFTFTVDHLSEDNVMCTSGLNHSYNVIVGPTGGNNPYFIRVIMIETTDPTQANYEQVVEYPTGASQFTIENIPSGTVRFESFNRCDNSIISSTTHDNCCIPFPCGLEGIYPANFGGASGDEHKFRYLSVNAVGLNECFENGESNVIITKPGGGNKNFVWSVDERCWTGNIEVVVEGAGEPFTMTNLTVVPHTENDDDSKVTIIDDNNWNPSQAGAYTIKILYTGTGESEGVDCVDEVSFDYYGPGNYASFLYFDKSDGFNFQDLPDEHASPYVKTAHCYGCPIPIDAIACPNCTSTGNYYLFEPSENCSPGSTPDWKYFKFIPENYGENPCNSGGWITYQGMDQSGNSSEISVYIPPNRSLHHIAGGWPQWYPDVPAGYTMSCEQTGWCLFEAEDVIGVQSADGQPIAVNYANLETCLFEPAPEQGGDDQPVDNECIPGSDDCGEGYTCDDNGNCIPDVECISEIDCPSGYTCEDGECVPIETNEGCQSGFITSYLQCGYDNPCSFTYSFGPPTVFRLEYRSYGYRDKFTVTINGVSTIIDCISTNIGPGGWLEREFPVQGNAEISILVESNCDEQADAFNWIAWCGANFDDGDDPGFTGGGNGNNIFLYPNPFTSDINLVFNNSEEQFSGKIKLINGQGVEVMAMNYDFLAGENSLLLQDIDNLQPGLYTVIIFGDNGLIGSKNVIKM